jgi:hypothetical protein
LLEATVNVNPGAATYKFALIVPSEQVAVKSANTPLVSAKVLTVNVADVFPAGMMISEGIFVAFELEVRATGSPGDGELSTT